MCIQIGLYVLWVIQSIAENTEEQDFGSKPLTVIVTILVVVFVMIMNAYLLFLYIYYGRNGMEQHQKYVEDLKRRKELAQQRRNGVFSNVVQGGAAQPQTFQNQIVQPNGPAVRNDFEEQQLQMAIQASIKDKNKQIYGDSNDVPDFLDNRDKEPAQIVPP